jgi:predicted ribosomally synthesized peptide with SipW-like signal peptide
MTDDDSAALNISRRKTLAALGTIGVASAGAGLGTSAYFSDQETFANNRLTAGTLDMVVDWEEHYSDWKGAETEHARMPTDEDDDEDIYSLPAPDDNPDAQDIELVFSDKQAFWDDTAIEAYPDPNNDALQELPEVPCDDLGSLSDVLSSDDRTENDWTAPGDPLISLEDVKPGDFGEVTLSFHLCDNPGFVWFGGDLITNSDGVQTEPEMDDPDEDDPNAGELAEQIQVRAWYDGDCDNMYEPEQDLCVYHLLDMSGSMEADLVDGSDVRDKDNAARDIARDITTALDANDEIGENGELESAPTSLGYVKNSSFVDTGVDNEITETTILNQLDDLDDAAPDPDNEDFPAGDFGGLSSFQAAFGDVEEDLVTNCENDGKYLIFYTNGDSRPDNDTDAQTVLDDAQALKDLGVTIKVVAFDVTGQTSTQFLTDLASPNEYHQISEGNLGAVQTDIDDATDSIIDQLQVSAGEEQFYSGTLLDFLTGAPFDPDNDELGRELTGDVPAEEGGGVGRNCFSAQTTHCIGFEWWLPIDHGNEVQGDIVEFDLGFYTEQCRHNDGEGMNSETVDGEA